MFKGSRKLVWVLSILKFILNSFIAFLEAGIKETTKEVYKNHKKVDEIKEQIDVGLEAIGDTRELISDLSRLRKRN